MLILDEPTNHLDLESREALESALNAFPGSVLLVSHDRALLDAVGTRTVAVEEQTLHSYVGGWPEYVRVREERAKIQPAAKKPPPRRPPRPRKQVDTSAGALRLEEQIELAEAALAAIEDELSDPAAWATPEASERSTSRHEKAKQQVAELYERWESVAG